VQGRGYTDQRTHTWAITRSAPTIEGAFRVYPGTWSVASFTAPLDYSASFVYTITALYPQGCGSTVLTVSPPRPDPRLIPRLAVVV
jgi:hypothetical protein